MSETPKATPVKTETPPPAQAPKAKQEEFGGQAGPDPTRYGDWEKNGRVSDF
jgi:hypothetical protein